MLYLLTVLRLAIAIGASPEVPMEPVHVALQIVAASDEYPPELISAIAFGESRFIVDSQSAPILVEKCKDGVCRIVTYWDCGPMQVRTSSPAKCRRLRTDASYGYAAGVQRLRDAAEFCGWQGDHTIYCTIAGYQAGVPGVQAYLAGSRTRTTKAFELLERAFEYSVARDLHSFVGSVRTPVRPPRPRTPPHVAPAS